MQLFSLGLEGLEFLEFHHFQAALHSTLVEWVAHCTKVLGSILEGDQKGHT